MNSNFRQGGGMASDRRFQALQTISGNCLLFSIGGDGIFWLTRETPGHLAGWIREDLSSAPIARDFAGAAAPLACTGFAAAQNPHSGSIGLAMVVGSDAGSHLYLSLNNLNPDGPWSCQWTACPYDNPDYPLPALAIVDASLSEADDGQYIVVDVLRDPASASGPVARFYIDAGKEGGYAWHPLDLSLELARDGCASRLGRRAGQLVDGLYTVGRPGEPSQLRYQPLYNAFDPGLPAPPSVYPMPGGVRPEALATARHADDTTDLYVSAAGALYYLSAVRQEQSGATPVLLNADPAFAGVRELHASVSNGEVVVWGLNRARQLFYTTCELGRQADAAAWTGPLTVLEDVARMSPYLNMANDANSFVVQTCGKQMLKAVKPAYRSLWRFREIALNDMDAVSPIHLPAGHPVPPGRRLRACRSMSGKAGVRVGHGVRTPA